MAQSTQTYGYGSSRPPKPVATAPLTTYGGLGPYTTGSRSLASSLSPYVSPPGAATNPDYGAVPAAPPVKQLSNPNITSTQVVANPPPAASSLTYDITTDPALQQITALTGRSDQDAQAAALSQEQNQLLGYGDPNLAQSVLGDPTWAQAAAQNPTSTLAQLAQQRAQNESTLTEKLNAANLFYGGYRITQEQQAAQDYQNQLAAAAAGVQNNLGTIQSNLAQALAANQAQRTQALLAAYAANPPGYGTPNPIGPNSSPTTTTFPSVDLEGGDPAVTGSSARPARSIGATMVTGQPPVPTTAYSTATTDPNVLRLAAALAGTMSARPV